MPAPIMVRVSAALIPLFKFCAIPPSGAYLGAVFVVAMTQVRGFVCQELTGVIDTDKSIAYI